MFAFDMNILNLFDHLGMLIILKLTLVFYVVILTFLPLIIKKNIKYNLVFFYLCLPLNYLVYLDTDSKQKLSVFSLNLLIFQPEYSRIFIFMNKNYLK